MPPVPASLRLQYKGVLLEHDLDCVRNLLFFCSETCRANQGKPSKSCQILHELNFNCVSPDEVFTLLPMTKFSWAGFFRNFSFLFCQIIEIIHHLVNFPVSLINLGFQFPDSAVKVF